MRSKFLAAFALSSAFFVGCEPAAEKPPEKPPEKPAPVDPVKAPEPAKKDGGMEGPAPKAPETPVVPPVAPEKKDETPKAP